MSPEKQQNAIAEACGWREKQEPVGSFNATAWWKNGDRYPSNTVPVPNYLYDLNAMHEAEKLLTDEQWLEYVMRLSGQEMAEGWQRCYLNLEAVRAVASATAAQKAEAFLKTIGKWEESK